jgi:Phosphoesterase family
MKALRAQLERAIAAAATLTGKRFGLLVASSVVATSAIVASALTGTGDSGALAAALLGSRPAAAPVAAAPAATPSPSRGKASSASASPAPVSAAPSAPPVLSESPAPAPPSKSERTPSEPAPTEASPEAGRVKHVFVISLASSGYDAAFGDSPQMPYLASTLRPQGELLSGYSLLDSAALPNQIAAISGQPPNQQSKENCPTFSEFPASSKFSRKGVVEGDGCLYPVEALTLADQMSVGHFKWRGYMEGMVDEAGKPDNCVHPETDGSDEAPLGGYAVRNNPFVFFHSLLDLGDCALNDVPLTQLGANLGKVDSTPNYALISPNLCNAGVTGQCAAGALEGAASADAFLAQWVPKILASPAYKEDGLLVITFGELNPPDPAAAAPPTAEPKVGALLLSRFVAPGATDAAPYDPYSLLRSVEDLFGLGHLALADGAKVKSFAPVLLGETGGD